MLHIGSSSQELSHLLQPGTRKRDQIRSTNISHLVFLEVGSEFLRVTALEGFYGIEIRSLFGTKKIEM